VPTTHLTKAGKVEFESHPTIDRPDGRQVAGLASNFGGHQVVKVADTVNGRKVRDKTGTATHEIGHTLDNSSGHSLSRSLAPTIRKDAARMSKADAYIAAHYLKNDRELFAEVYKLTHSPSKKGAFGLGQKKAEKLFAKSIAAMREIKP
jgi:hypothetical protein